VNRAESSGRTTPRAPTKVGMRRAMTVAMTRKRPNRSPFVVTLGAALLGGCGGQTVGSGNPPPQADAGPVVGGHNPPAPVCPTQIPNANDTCDLPDGRMCSWGGMCDEISAECSGGRWLFASINPPAPVCPATAPSFGDDCSALCLPPGFTCDFPNPDCPGTGALVATCDDGTWASVATSCSGPTFPDAGEIDASLVADGGAGD
jgi:hypothetical protein